MSYKSWRRGLGVVLHLYLVANIEKVRLLQNQNKTSWIDQGWSQFILTAKHWMFFLILNFNIFLKAVFCVHLIFFQTPRRPWFILCRDSSSLDWINIIRLQLNVGASKRISINDSHSRDFSLNGKTHWGNGKDYICYKVRLVSLLLRNEVTNFAESLRASYGLTPKRQADSMQQFMCIQQETEISKSPLSLSIFCIGEHCR